MHGIAVSDGDNDGADEVYAACEDGHAYQYKKTGTQWVTTDLGNTSTALYAIAVGDADNDHNYEVYALGQSTHVFQFKAATAATPTPTATPAITATPVPPQKSVKILGSQINPELGEQATIKWTQPQSGQVSITIYTLNGDKVISLVDHQNYGAGQYNEVKWNGKNEDGQTVGSGIYIVLLQAPGYQDVQKIAVIK
jgi:hypothetical protein